jgi:hypothetical protein
VAGSVALLGLCVVCARRKSDLILVGQLTSLKEHVGRCACPPDLVEYFPHLTKYIRQCLSTIGSLVAALLVKGG